MPRKYQPRKKAEVRRSTKKIPIETLKTALHHVKESGMSIRKAAREVNINEKSLRNYMKDLSLGKERTNMPIGNPTYLPEASEQQLASLLATRAQWGFAVTREELQDLVTEFVDINQ